MMDFIRQIGELMFRLHIDIQLCEEEEASLKTAEQIIKAINVQSLLKVHETFLSTDHVFQYRVAKDEDRRVSNYLIKDKNGHVSTAKIKISI